MRRRVAVVGGGVSGLAVAYHLTRPGLPGDEPGGRPPPEVVLIEADHVLGGKVRTVSVGGAAADTGPDALMIRAAPVTDLLAELGLTGALVRPAAKGSYLWCRGALRPLATGSVLGVPAKPWALLRSGVLGPLGVVRAAADLLLPAGRDTAADPSVEQLLRPRLGGQVFDRLIDPLIGGVFAGRAGQLSADSCVPELARMLRGRRSVYLALRGRPTSTGGSPMATLGGGLVTLIEALRLAVVAAGGQVRAGAAVTALHRSPDPVAARRRWRISMADGTETTADSVVLATPAYEAARLLAPLAPDLAGELDAIPYAGVATITLAFAAGDVPGPLDGTGFLVPPTEHRLLVACTWLSSKWPVAAGGRPGAQRPALLRCTVGRHGDQAWAGMDDAQLVRAVRADLADAMGIQAEPSAVFVRRIPRAIPQYVVGHAARLARIDSVALALPGLHLAGAAYRGVGLASCLTSSATTARDVLADAGERVLV